MPLDIHECTTCTMRGETKGSNRKLYNPALSEAFGILLVGLGLDKNGGGSLDRFGSLRMIWHLNFLGLCVFACISNQDALTLNTSALVKSTGWGLKVKNKRKQKVVGFWPSSIYNPVELSQVQTQKCGLSCTRTGYTARCKCCRPKMINILTDEPLVCTSPPTDPQLIIKMLKAPLHQQSSLTESSPHAGEAVRMHDDLMLELHRLKHSRQLVQ